MLHSCSVIIIRRPVKCRRKSYKSPKIKTELPFEQIIKHFSCTFLVLKPDLQGRQL